MFAKVLTSKHMFGIIRTYQTYVQEGCFMKNLISFISSRKVALIAVIVIASVLYVSISNKDVTEADANSASSKYYACITVQPGDTLWDIAQVYMTDEYSSVQEYIDDVVYTNELKSASNIKAGSVLLVPYYKVTDLSENN
jgi:hypothetical protein